jgi:hypothetical protein
VGALGSVLAWAIGGLLAFGLGGAVGATADRERPSALLPSFEVPAVNASTVALAVDPSTWWTLAGDTDPFDAVWMGIPPGCSLAPEWYRWAVGGTSVGGTLDPTDRAATNFSAISASPASTELTVRAAAALSCGGRAVALLRSATSNVTVDAPLVIGNVSVGPSVADPGAPVVLYGSLAGGTPPFLVRVGWGDGNVSWTNLTSAGPFALSHAFPAGEFAPSVIASDTDGLTANASVPEPVTVSRSLAVGIDPSSYVAEVGVPVTFRAELLHPPSNFSWVGYCVGATGEVARAVSATPELNCTFAAPGPENVGFGVSGEGFALESASALLREGVVPPLRLSLRAPGAPAELGGVVQLPVDLEGGVPPFRVTWTFVGNRSTGERTVLVDGSIFLPVWPIAAGADRISVTVEDAAGVVSTNATLGLNVSLPLAASAAAAGAAAPNATAVELSGTVEAGVSPFEWVAVPSTAPVSGTNFSGVLPASGSFDWNGTFQDEAELGLSVGVVDAAGATWTESFSVRPVPVLALAVALAPGGAGVLDVNATVEGGVPPFAAWVNTSAGTSWNTTLSVDGNVVWKVSLPAVGNISATVTVVDRLGRAASSTARTQLGPPAPAPLAPAPPRGDGAEWAVAAGLLGLAGIVAFALARRRRRAPEPTAPPPDPTEVLRHLIEPSDGVDRATVELLAEEAGVPFESARLTLDRLIVQGRVRSEAGADGEEVLAWAPPEAP